MTDDCLAEARGFGDAYRTGNHGLEDFFGEVLAHIVGDLVREVGAPVSSTHGPQLAGPTDVVRWYAELLENYEFSEDLGEREMFGLQARLLSGWRSSLRPRT